MEDIKEIKRVVLVGSGNLAEALAAALACSPFHTEAVISRNEARGRAVAALGGTVWYESVAEAPEADLYLIAVSDRAVGEVAAALDIPQGKIVAHTAGCVPLDALAPHPLRAVFYPLQTFTKGRRVDFGEIPVFVEGSSAEVERRMTEFARALSRRVEHASGERRRRIHLAGVFANNFANHMFALGEEVMRSADLDFDCLKPIIRETAAKACASHSPAEVQTGPAARGDRGSIERHLELLADKREIKEIYIKTSQNIWETSKKT